MDIIHDTSSITAPRPAIRATAVAAIVAFGLSLTACGVGNADSPTNPRDQLARLHMATPGSSAGYSRQRFGKTWADTDHNHCDTRNDILARDLTGVRRRGHCIVTAGTLHDRYTGKTLAFRRGTASAQVQIDHIYPLHRMWVMGAARWSRAQREKVANDRRNLIAVDGAANESKGDRGPAEWVPRQQEWCDYATRYIAVATAYRLPITAADKAALGHMLTPC